MAKLSAHGREIGRIAYLTYTKAYMADGAILKNSGDGWKLAAKVKPHIDPAEHFATQQARVNANRAANPDYAQYVKVLHGMTSMANRWKLHAAVELLGDDIDGIWSECCDGYQDNVHADCEEIAELVHAYNAWQATAKQPAEA